MDVKPTEMKAGDWSLSLEDESYVENTNEIFTETISAIQQTKNGHYVNIITPERCGDPNEWMIPQLKEMLTNINETVSEIRFVDMCGCGGYVTRITRG